MKFTIRELETLSGIKAHTIRIWEQRYRFLKPSRTLTNIRTYSNDELKTLLTVALLNKYGLRISRIDQMSEDERSNALFSINNGSAREEALVNDMIGCMIDLKAIEFEQLVQGEIDRVGVENAVPGLIFNFLEKVGLLWQTNRIIPIQEHLVSNIIRQKIIVAIDRLPPAKNSPYLFMMFLPEDEHHELGLLYVYYLLKKQGIPVIYLGANLPLKDASHMLDIKRPTHIYIHLTSFPRKQQLHRFLQRLNVMAGTCKTFVSGVVPEHPTEFSSITFINSLKEAQRVVTSIG